MNDELTPGNVPLNGVLGPLPEARWLWASGDRPYCDSYSADQMRAYAAAAVAAERERCASMVENWDKPDGWSNSRIADRIRLGAQRCR